MQIMLDMLYPAIMVPHIYFQVILFFISPPYFRDCMWTFCLNTDQLRQIAKFKNLLILMYQKEWTVQDLFVNI